MSIENKNIMPSGLVNTMDLVRGVAEVAAETAIRGLRRALHRYPEQPFASHGDHDFTPPAEPTERMATIEQNFDESGRHVFDGNSIWIDGEWVSLGQ